MRPRADTQSLRPFPPLLSLFHFRGHWVGSAPLSPQADAEDPPFRVLASLPALAT